VTEDEDFWFEMSERSTLDQTYGSEDGDEPKAPSPNVSPSSSPPSPSFPLSESVDEEHEEPASSE
jgi:hypothetical protein